MAVAEKIASELLEDGRESAIRDAETVRAECIRQHGKTETWDDVLRLLRK